MVLLGDAPGVVSCGRGWVQDISGESKSHYLVLTGSVKLRSSRGNPEELDLIQSSGSIGLSHLTAEGADWASLQPPHLESLILNFPGNIKV